MKSKIISALFRTKESVSQFLKQYITVSQPKFKKISSDRTISVLRILGFTLWLIFPFLCLLIGEYICFIKPGASVFGSENLTHITLLFSEKWGVMLLDLAILYIASLVIACFVKRLWISCAVLGTASFCFSAASFFKYQVTGEYFYPWDLAQTGNVGILTDYINTDIPPQLFVAAALIIVVTAVVLVSKVSLPIRWNIRVPAAIITVCALLLTYSSAENAANLVQDHGMDFDIVYNGEENYAENGFFGAITLNILSQTVKSPEEYSKDTITDILKNYKGKEASADFSYPNIIVILQESFWDIRQFPGCTFSVDPLENYDKIVSRDGVYSGNMISPTFGGGTVRPEFELLTGLTADYLPSGSIPYQYITDSFESYPLMMRDMGYSTVAIHPYLSSFYTRDEKYPYLGFDKTLFNEDLIEIESVESTNRGGFTSDDSFAGYIEYFLETSDKPLFLFGISMEGHQPYENKFASDELEISISCPGFDKELENTVSQYAQCLMDADASLGRLTGYIDSLEEDTILVVFGDHAPSLGNDKAAYRNCGYISDEGLTGEDMENILATPFFIYSNFETKESTMLSIGTDNVISPYNLMNAALELTGAPETPLMEFLKDYYSVCRAYNIKLETGSNSLTDRFIKAHEFLSYDRIRGEGYSLLAE